MKKKIGLFKPKKFVVATLMGPIEVEFVEHKPRMFQLECDDEKDGAPFEAKSLQEAQEKVLALNGNVVKEIE